MSAQPSLWSACPQSLLLTIYRVGAPAVEGCLQKSSEIYARTIAARIVCGYYSETRAVLNQPPSETQMAIYPALSQSTFPGAPSHHENPEAHNRLGAFLQALPDGCEVTLRAGPPEGSIWPPMSKEGFVREIWAGSMIPVRGGWDWDIVDFREGLEKMGFKVSIVKE